MITYQVERFENVIEEMMPILELHWEEIAHHKDRIKLNPDYALYQSMQDAGILHIVTARDNNRLIGYFISVVSPNLHYSDHLYATNDILYIDKEHRGKMVGIKLFKFAEKELYNLGVDVIVLHSKVQADFKSLVERIGYTHVENQYSKYIGDA